MNPARVVVEDAPSPDRVYTPLPETKFSCPLCQADVTIQICDRPGHVMHGCAYVEVSWLFHLLAQPTADIVHDAVQAQR